MAQKFDCDAINCPSCNRMFFVFEMEHFDFNKTITMHTCPRCDFVIVEDWSKEYMEKANKLLSGGDEDERETFFHRLNPL